MREKITILGRCFQHFLAFGVVWSILSSSSAFGNDPQVNSQLEGKTFTGCKPSVLAGGVAGQWDVYEVALATTNNHTNPFDVTLNATLSGPNGESRAVIGFFAGDNVYKLRFLATQLGVYQWMTSSSDPDLDGRSGVFEVVSSSLPSMVVVDSTYPSQFRYANGDHILLRAYYCLNLLGADKTHPIVGGWRDFIDHLASYGYNALFFNAMAVGQTTTATEKMPPWNVVRDDPPSHAFRSGDVADFFFVPWPKTGTTDQQPNPGGNVDFTRSYVLLWDELDRILSYLRDKGMVAHIMFYPDDNPYVLDLEPYSANEQRFLRYLIARVGAYSNVIWNDGIDLLEYRSVPSWVLWWAQFFEDNDPWRHPRSSRHFSGKMQMDYLREESPGGKCRPTTNWCRLLSIAWLTQLLENTWCTSPRSFLEPFRLTSASPPAF